MSHDYFKVKYFLKKLSTYEFVVNPWYLLRHTINTAPQRYTRLV